VSKPKHEVADILNFGFEDYLVKHYYKLPKHKVKTARAISNCRTANLGAHKDQCTECGHIRISYNSCRNRHCPKCQNLAKEKWLEKRTEELLPVQYFHVVFTIPDLLNDIMLNNQTLMYDILFKAASQTILDLCKNRMNSRSGVMAILHTWGQNLSYHPHLHCIVPGGGLSAHKTKWVNSKKKYLIPVKVISAVFKGKFMELLKLSYKNKTLFFTGSSRVLYDKKDFQNLLDKLYSKNWVVFTKKPFGSPLQVLSYLGRYTHRVAISNHRIKNIDYEKSEVSFEWKDYRDSSRKKIMTISIQEFIRRYLNHILPHGFIKIRYFGIFACRIKAEMIKLCKKLLKTEIITTKKRKNWIELLLDLTGVDIRICPCCKKGEMIRFSPKLSP